MRKEHGRHGITVIWSVWSVKSTVFGKIYWLKNAEKQQHGTSPLCNSPLYKGSEQSTAFAFDPKLRILQPKSVISHSSLFPKLNGTSMLWSCWVTGAASSAAGGKYYPHPAPLPFYQDCKMCFPSEQCRLSPPWWPHCVLLSWADSLQAVSTWQAHPPNRVTTVTSMQSSRSGAPTDPWPGTKRPWLAGSFVLG